MDALEEIEREEDDGPEVVAPEWPAPPDRAAYYGLAGTVADVIAPETEADPVGILASVLVQFGSAVGRGAQPRGPLYRVGAASHYANEFAVLVGRTSKGRKGSAWEEAHRPLRLATSRAAWLREAMQDALHDNPAALDGWADTCTLTGLSSGEGLIYTVRDEVWGKSKKGETELIDEGVTDKRLLVFEPEFAKVMKVMARDGNTLGDILRQAWDDGGLRSATKNAPLRATDAHVSMLAHITRAELIRRLDATDAANGTLNRFLWVAVKRARELPDGGNLSDRDLSDIAEVLAMRLSEARCVSEMERSPAARDLWHDVYHDLGAEVPGLLGAAIARAEAHVLRLSMIYALTDASRTIERHHLEAALALWNYCERSARYVFADRLGDPLADELLAILKRAPGGMARTAINRALGGNYPKAKIATALGALLDFDLARREKRPPEGGTGRWPEVWFYGGTKETKEGRKYV